MPRKGKALEMTEQEQLAQLKIITRALGGSEVKRNG